MGDIWDITSIGSSFITFIMYCLMSQQFRMEMYTLILPKRFTKRFNLQTNQQPLNSRISVKQRGTMTHPAVLIQGAVPLTKDL